MPLTNVADQARKNQVDYVRLFKSYPEAASRGYHSLKRLKEMGLSVPDSTRPKYSFLVATRFGNLPVYSREQASGSREPAPVPGEEAPSPDPTESRSFLPKKEPTAKGRDSPMCGKIAHRPDLKAVRTDGRRSGARGEEPSLGAPATSSTRRRTWTSPSPTRTRRTRSASSSTSSSRASSSTSIRSKGSHTTTTPWARGSWAEGPRARRTSGSSTATC